MMTDEIFTLILLMLCCWDNKSDASRVKRQGLPPPPIIYPFGGTFKGTRRLSKVETVHVIKTNAHEEGQVWHVARQLYSFSVIRRLACENSLVVGFAVPIEFPGRILVYGQNFQFQYALPPNATFFTEFFQGASSSRRRRASVSRDERTTVYGLLEKEFERRGIDGKECVKKTICEAALAPLEDEGLVGELLHLFLTPQEAENSSVDSEYLEALEFGRSNHDCSQIYQSCLPGQGILDQISSVIP